MTLGTISHTTENTTQDQCICQTNTFPNVIHKTQVSTQTVHAPNTPQPLSNYHDVRAAMLEIPSISLNVPYICGISTLPVTFLHTFTDFLVSKKTRGHLKTWGQNHNYAKGTQKRPKNPGDMVSPGFLDFLGIQNEGLKTREKKCENRNCKACQNSLTPIAARFWLRAEMHLKQSLLSAEKKRTKQMKSKEK